MKPNPNMRRIKRSQVEFVEEGEEPSKTCEFYAYSNTPISGVFDKVDTNWLPVCYVRELEAA